MAMNFQNRSVDSGSLAMVPRNDVQRSVFMAKHTHKTTFDAGYLVPFYLTEILPGDSFSVRATLLVRLQALIAPIMDSIHLETFFFFVPCRLLWDNWDRFMGARNPSDSAADNIIPVTTIDVSASNTSGIYDYFGLPIHAPNNVTVNALPFRAYNLIYNEWFRDENIIDTINQPMGDGPDNPSNYYALKRRGKRHDYFTSSLPWPQKGSSVLVPLVGQAPVKGIGFQNVPMTYNTNVAVYETPNSGFTAGAVTYPFAQWDAAASNPLITIKAGAQGGNPQIFADLSAATSLTINALRQSFMMQRLLENDARGGTRYTEIVRRHFGVISPDARLQRPEYLGGGHSMIETSAIPQTSATGATGTPQANLAATAQGVAQHGYSKSFTEHGYVLGIVNVRADLTYQQGRHRMWTRSTRYDFYWPEFAGLGEQSVLRGEIYTQGNVNDDIVFGYQARYDEYRYQQSIITGKFRSTASGTLDFWHLSQKFTSAPTLSQTFIEDSPPIARILAAGSAADGQQFLMDCFFSTRMVRPIPAYGVPGIGGRL